MNMTLEQAIKILHPVGEDKCVTDDEFFDDLDQIEPALLLACEVMQREVERRADHSGEANKMVEVVVSKTENEPLTLEELRGMDGEPVWVSFLNSKVSISGQWHLVRNITDEVINCFENYMPFCDYGKTWLAYRQKPNGGEG